jgi:undecaprenyl pyrophosphate phosphatase UppP
MKNYKLFPKVTLWILLALGIIASVMFYVGGSAGSLEVAGDFLDIPKFTDMFLTWIYLLVAMVVLVTFGFVIAKFVETYKVDKKKAITSLGVIVAGVLLCVLCWVLGSPEKMEIIGYEGTDNVGNMARMADAIMYLVYILTAATVVSLVWGVIYTKVKK